MIGKFKIANGLNATLRWIGDVKDVAESCHKKGIMVKLAQHYAVITIDVDDEQVHFVQAVDKTNHLTAKRIMHVWSSDPDADCHVNWVVYHGEAHFLGSSVGHLLSNSVKRKIAPSVIALLQDDEP